MQGLETLCSDGAQGSDACAELLHLRTELQAAQRSCVEGITPLLGKLDLGAQLSLGST